MAFQFPDPQTTPEFTADNGITYAWDVDDSKWQIKTLRLLILTTATSTKRAAMKWKDRFQGSEQSKYSHHPETLGGLKRTVFYTVVVVTLLYVLELTVTAFMLVTRDTSFNGLVKIDELSEKNTNNGIKVQSPVKMNQNQIKNLAEATQDKDAVNYGQVKQELIDALTGSSAVLEQTYNIVNKGLTLPRDARD